MDNKELLFQVKKSKEQIESLLDISSVNMDAMLIELFSRMSIIENSFNDSNLKKKYEPNFESQVEQFVRKEIVNIFTAFLTKGHFKSVNLIFNCTGDILWDLKLVSILPHFLNAASFFKFTDIPNLVVENYEVKLIGTIATDQNIENYRPEIYKEMRALLRNRAMLTYSLDEVKNLFSLSCTVDQKDKKFYLTLNQSDGITLALPSVISKFIADKTPSHSHLCLEIAENYSLIKHQGVPRSLTRISEPNEKLIFYFPFVFRPISLIIPMKGQNLPQFGVHNNKNTGCVENGLAFIKDQGLEKKVVNIDLFFHFHES